jgi:hypothetical protein
MSLAEKNNDWMRELEHDAQQFTAVVQRVDELAGKALADLTIRKNYLAVGLRLAEIQEGLQLLCTLAGIKVTPYVSN